MDGFTIVVIVFLIVFVGMAFMMVFSTNFRSKMLGRQMKISKSLLEDNKDNFKDLARVGAEMQKEILTENEDVLKEVSSKQADIESVGIEKKAAAFKKGITGDGENDTKFCKHCGAKIEADSIFCKECGKKQ